MGDFGRRLIIWIVIVGSIYALYEAFDGDGVYEAPRRPLPPSDGRAWFNTEPATPPTGELQTRPNFNMLVEDDGEPEDSIGTAFLVAPRTWLTAAHVLESCAKAYVRVRDEWRPITSKTLHPVADVAIATTGAPADPPKIELTDRLPVLNQEGFHFGYPHGNPTSVYTRFVGLARIRAGKPGKPVEQGWVWAEQERSPAGSGPLGGISGGPQVDRTGAVHGVTILYAERSARLTTAPVSRAREVLSKDVATVPQGGTTIAPTDYGRHGEHVREAAGTVSLVFCSVSGRTRPR